MPKKILTTAMQTIFWVAVLVAVLAGVQVLEALKPSVTPAGVANASVTAEVTSYPLPDWALQATQRAYPPPGPTATVWDEPADIIIPEGADISITEEIPPTRTPLPTPTLKADAAAYLVPTPTLAADAAGRLVMVELEDGSAPAILEVWLDGQGQADQAAKPVRTRLTYTPEVELELPRLGNCFIRPVNAAGTWATVIGEEMYCSRMLIDLQAYQLLPIEALKSTIEDIYEWHPNNHQVLIIDIGYVLKLVSVDPVDNRRIVEVRIGGISYASMTSDGQTIVYSAYNRDDRREALYTIDQWGRNNQVLLTGLAVVNYIDISPDNEQILFYDGAWHLLKLDGSDYRQLEWSYGNPYWQYARWSPDSRYILLTSEGVPYPEKKLWSAERYTDTRTVLIDAEQGTQVAWSAEADGSLWSPVWSPDGEYIAYLSQRSGTVEVWVCKRDGSQPRQVTADGLPKVLLGWFAD